MRAGSGYGEAAIRDRLASDAPRLRQGYNSPVARALEMAWVCERTSSLRYRLRM